MAQSASSTTREFARRLRDSSGLPFTVGAIAEREGIGLPAIDEANVFTRNFSADMAEKALSAKYPSIYVYCDRVNNDLGEKFRTFSGTATMNAEIRVSHDHVDGLEQSLQLYVEALTDVLDNNRGPWQTGMFYPGRYEVQFGAVKPGGKRFLQTAKVRFEVHISKD